MTTSKLDRTVTLKDLDLDAIGDDGLAARLHFIAEAPRWNSDAELIAAVVVAATASTAVHKAGTTFQRRCDDAGVAPHRIDSLVSRARMDSDTLAVMHDLVLVSERLNGQRRVAITALNAIIEQAMRSPEIETLARNQIGQARRLSGQARNALDVAHDLLAEVESFLCLDSPGVSNWTMRLINARLDGDSREVYLDGLAEQLVAKLDASAGATA